MALFRCENCGCVENTACCNYWGNRLDKKPPLCSACDPEIGAWHGNFDRRPADGMLIDKFGHLWSKEQVAAGALPPHNVIVGEVPASATQPTTGDSK